MASQPRNSPRIARVFGAVNIGSFRISAMIAGLTEGGEMIVLGSGHRAAQGIRRGYVTARSGRHVQSSAPSLHRRGNREGNRAMQPQPYLSSSV